MGNPNGNPGYRVADPMGFIPRFGEVTDYCRRTGLSRIIVLAGLRTGRFYVGAEGLIHPRPVEASDTYDG